MSVALRRLCLPQSALVGEARPAISSACGEPVSGPDVLLLPTPDRSLRRTFGDYNNVCRTFPRGFFPQFTCLHEMSTEKLTSHIGTFRYPCKTRVLAWKNPGPLGRRAEGWRLHWLLRLSVRSLLLLRFCSRFLLMRGKQQVMAQHRQTKGKCSTIAESPP